MKALELFFRFGRHKTSCLYLTMKPSNFQKEHECTCGFEKALNAIRVIDEQAVSLDKQVKHLEYNIHILVVELEELIKQIYCVGVDANNDCCGETLMCRRCRDRRRLQAVVDQVKTT